MSEGDEPGSIDEGDEGDEGDDDEGGNVKMIAPADGSRM
jgi:hypothetical protein